jgi:ABC-type sugar transport system ATPase subunit
VPQPDGGRERAHHARQLSGFGWRRRAGALIADKLDAIFPGHGIRPDSIVADLSIGRRQMVEVARAFSQTDTPVRLVILDEPTSSLDSHVADQLLNFVRRFVDGGGSCILISHLLGEVLNYSDRIVVMRDGKVVDARSAAAFSRDTLVAAMGSVARETTRPSMRPRPSGRRRASLFAPPLPTALPRSLPTAARLSVWPAWPAMGRPSC